MAGEDAVFSVEASGLNLQYEWRFTGEAISVITRTDKYSLSDDGATLTVMNVDSTDMRADYMVRVSNDGGVTDSVFVELQLSKTLLLFSKLIHIIYS